MEQDPTALPRAAGESRFDRLLQLSASYERVDGRRARDHAHDALREANTLDDRPALGRAHLALAKSYWTLTNFEEATDHAKTALAIFKELGSVAERAHAHLTLNKIYIVQSRYIESFRAGAAARDAYREAGDPRGAASALNDLGVTLLGIGDFDAATARLREAEGILKQHDDPLLLARVYVNLGEVNHEQEQLDRASDYFTAAHALFERLGTDHCGLAAVTHDIAEIHRERGRLDDALEGHREALRLRDSVGNRRGQASSYGALGATHVDRGELDSAAKYLKRALSLAQELDLPLLAVRTYRHLSSLHEASGQYEQALIDYKKYHQLHRSLYDDQRRVVLEFLHAGGDAATGNEIRDDTATPETTHTAAPLGALVVETEEIVRSVVTELLRRDGMQVFTATDAHSALALFRTRRHEVDVVLLDLSLPDLPGSATLYELRRLAPDTGIVLTSARPRHEAIYGISGELHFLQKPFDAEALVGCLRSVAGTRRS